MTVPEVKCPICDSKDKIMCLNTQGEKWKFKCYKCETEFLSRPDIEWMKSYPNLTNLYPIYLQREIEKIQNDENKTMYNCISHKSVRITSELSICYDSIDICKMTDLGITEGISCPCPEHMIATEETLRIYKISHILYDRINEYIENKNVLNNHVPDYYKGKRTLDENKLKKIKIKNIKKNNRFEREVTF